MSSRSPLQPLLDAEGRFPGVRATREFVVRGVSGVLSACRRHLRTALGVAGLINLCAALLRAPTENGFAWGDLATGMIVVAMWAGLDAPPAETRLQQRCGVAGGVMLLPGVVLAFLATRDWAGPVFGIVSVALLAMSATLLQLGRGPRPTPEAGEKGS
jgi:hypothetical protein